MFAFTQSSGTVTSACVPDCWGVHTQVSDLSDVHKTTRFKTNANTKTEGHKTKTKTIGPITTYSLLTVNEIIFYSTIFYNVCTLSTS